MKHIKRLLPLLLILALALSACAPKQGGGQAKTPEEYAEAYASAIQAARDDEMNEYFPVTTNATGFSDAMEEEMVFSLLGFTKEDTDAYAISLSLMNVSAYAIVAVKPAEGKEKTVKTGLENYVEAQKSAFEYYLEDQFKIASSAKLDTLSDGTLLLVMAEGQDTLYDAIRDSLSKADK